MDFQFLNPTQTRIEEAPDGTIRVEVENDRCGLKVETLCAFPLSHPDEYIVLRDGKGKQLGVLRRLDDVPTKVSELLREQLRRRYFLPRVMAILNITERFGSSVWDLDTDRGPCTVSTKQMNEAVAEIDPGRYLITDVEGNRYEIKDLAELDADSRARFQGKY